MKKIIALILSSVMAICPMSALAEEYDNFIVNTIKVNVNTATVFINAEAVESENAPYITAAGVTMMELYTLAEGIGAEVSEENDVVSVIYDDVEMIYTVGSLEAVIAGQSISMPEAVVRNSKGAVMAPLRFVAEALGADVAYNGELGEIIITASGDLDDGINYKLLFKYSGKTKVGNSAEHWRFKKTDNFDMSDNYGGYYSFAMDDIYVNLAAEKNTDNLSINQLYMTVQGNSGYYSRSVMYEKGKSVHGNVPYAYAKYRTGDTVYEYYAYSTDEFVYYIDIERTFERFSGSESHRDVEEFLSSLEFDYKGGDEENTVDFATTVIKSDEDKSDKTEYTDGNYSWSVKLCGGWEVEEYYGFYNSVVITRLSSAEDEEDLDLLYDDYTGIYDPTITINTYSNEEKLSLIQWASKKREFYVKTLNSEECTVTPLKDCIIGSVPAKTFDVSDGENVSRFYYLAKGSYKYVIDFTYNKGEEKDAEFLTSANTVIMSFMPGDINEDEVGKALETDNEEELIEELKKFEGDKFSFSYPCLWDVEETEIGVYVSQYYSGAEILELISGIMPGFAMLGAEGVSAKIIPLKYYNDDLSISEYSVEEYMKKNLASVLNMSGSLINVALTKSPFATTLAGKKGYVAEFYAESQGDGLDYTVYFLQYDKDNALIITKACNNMLSNTIYEEAMDKVIKSLKVK